MLSRARSTLSTSLSLSLAPTPSLIRMCSPMIRMCYHPSREALRFTGNLCRFDFSINTPSYTPNGQTHIHT